MKLKGIEKLREKLPAYPGKRIALLPLGAAFVSLLGYLFLIILDVLPRFFSDIEALAMIEPYLPILGSLLIMALAFMLIGQVWNAREKMKAEYGDLAYQKMLPRGLAGVFLVPPLIFHQLTSIRSLLPGPPVNELTIQWSQSILPVMGIPPELEVWVRMIVSSVIFILGLLTMRSAILTFGVDYMAVVYLYFPEESEIQDHEIYSVIRHPTYFAGVLLGIAALIFRFSVYSILMFIIVFALFWLQARREEKELVDRFGESYEEYMRRVPRFLLRSKDIRLYFSFLRGAI
ncbi:MAG: methyltransferase family protein [Candidatus Thorarchaeota archaeon]